MTIEGPATTARPFSECQRCGEPVIGPRAIGAAAVPELQGYVCGECATIEEHAAYLARLIENGGTW